MYERTLQELFSVGIEILPSGGGLPPLPLSQVNADPTLSTSFVSSLLNQWFQPPNTFVDTVLATTRVRFPRQISKQARHARE